MGDSHIKIQPTTSMIVKHPNGIFCIPDESAHRFAAKKIIAGKAWEPKTLALMAKEAAKGDVIHGGTFFGDALPTLSKACKGTVWAFEPNPSNFAAASKTISLNKLSNVRLTNAAMSDHTGIMEMRTRDNKGTAMGGGSKLLRASKGDERVNLIRLDDTVKTSRLSLLHLDVELHEAWALGGAFGLIETHLPLIILETPPLKSEAWAKLKRLGYRVTATFEENTILKVR